MQKPVSDEVARGRWLTINVLRLGGVAMVVAGMLGTRQVIAIPVIAAYALIAVGLLDVFLVPLFLARKWRSPLE
jgi:hypothetical protein